MSWIRAAQSVILCISRSLTNRSMSPTQLKCICDIGRESFLEFGDLLNTQEWTSIVPEHHWAVLEGRRAQWPGIFPHRLSKLLTGWIICPLTLLCEDKRALRAVPYSLIVALKEAWSAVGRAYPHPLDLLTLHSIPMRTSMSMIGRELHNLEAIVIDIQKTEDFVGILTSDSQS